MKKVVLSVIALGLMLVCFASCNKTDATKNVIDMIKNIGTVTDGSGDYLDEIASAYDALSDKEKKGVNNYNKYEKAKTEYEDIAAFNDDIAAVVDAATTTFTHEDVNFTDLIARGNELLGEYDKMDKKRQSKVIGIEKVQEALDILAVYEENAVNCAASYCQAFLEVNKGKNYKITDLGCILQIRDSNEYLFFALTYTDGKNEKSVYSTARFGDPSVYSVICQRPEIFFAKEPVNESSDALTNGNTKLDLEQVLAVEVKK